MLKVFSFVRQKRELILSVRSLYLDSMLICIMALQIFHPAFEIVFHLLDHDHSVSTSNLFDFKDFGMVLRTTTRFNSTKTCPLTYYNVYGIGYEYGACLCSGYTFNTNVYFHLISFHKMTEQAVLC